MYEPARGGMAIPLLKFYLLQLLDRLLDSRFYDLAGRRPLSRRPWTPLLRGFCQMSDWTITMTIA
jgi:hypothetical protein